MLQNGRTTTLSPEAGQMALLRTHSRFPIIYASLVSYTLSQAAKLKIVLLTTNTSPPDCGIYGSHKHPLL